MSGVGPTFAEILGRPLVCGHEDTDQRIVLLESPAGEALCGECFRRLNTIVHDFHTGAIDRATVRVQLRAAGFGGRSGIRAFVRDTARGGFPCPQCHQQIDDTRGGIHALLRRFRTPRPEAAVP